MIFLGRLTSMKLLKVLQIANYWINRPPILVRTVPAISVPNVPLAIFKEYWD